MTLRSRLCVKPDSDYALAHADPAGTPGFPGPARRARVRAERELPGIIARLAKLQYTLFAENTRALLVVLQGIDTAGKDGVIRHVYSGLNPQGCHVTSFKKPSEIEQDHDFLWRIHQAVPGKGEIGVFNRSHYEDVLVVRVHDLVPKKVWKARYEIINEFERYLVRGGVAVVKFFLHISRDEQLARLNARLKDPGKNWKFSSMDIEERKRWDDYQDAYDDMLTRCSTRHAPWYVIPGDRKWYRNWACARILLDTLKDMDPKTPKPSLDVTNVRFE